MSGWDSLIDASKPDAVSARGVANTYIAFACILDKVSSGLDRFTEKGRTLTITYAHYAGGLRLSHGGRTVDIIPDLREASVRCAAHTFMTDAVRYAVPDHISNVGAWAEDIAVAIVGYLNDGTSFWKVR